MAGAAAKRKPTPKKPTGAAKPKTKPPVEYSILYTATLCLLAGGAVMVYSASSAESLIQQGDAAYYLKRYLLLGAFGLLALHVISRRDLRQLKALTPLAMLAGFGLTIAVMVPGVGVTVNGATRWLGAGPLQFQPSEILKFALILYAAQLLAARPKSIQTLGGVCKPLLLVVGFACALLMKQPDMGTALVVCFAIGALLVAAGVPLRHLGVIVGIAVVLITILAIAEPYRRARLMSFADPWADAGGSGFQAVQSMIAIGSGGFFGVGLGESVQKVFYLPEAHTDMILAIIGEELGVLGIGILASLYGMIGYAGFRTAKLARDRYSTLLAAGITSLILAQASLNFFAVMGLAPLTGVPLPFVSYGNSNLIVMLGGMGLLLNVAANGGLSARKALRSVDGGSGAGDRRAQRDRTRRAAG
ncbi:MAG: cell division protein FtsW [Solirubrobacteraceae bacterium]|jgi:cell division protein FtsW|nr:cell division protein FtsW [Solirubrobacteraceae bacterium]